MNMNLDLILGILFWLGILGLLGLLWRKWSILKLINPKLVVDINQQEVKHKLVQMRLMRSARSFVQTLTKKISTPVSKITKPNANKYWQGLENKLVAEIEHKLSPQVAATELKSKSIKALKEGNYESSEQYLLDAIAKEPGRLEFYQSLAEVYLAKRDFEPAREVLEYLITKGDNTAYLNLARANLGQGLLNEARAAFEQSLEFNNSLEIRLELAHVLEDLGDSEGALVQVSAALQLESNNPKVLDFFIELSIVNGRLIEASEALNRLKTTNPDNQKIADFAQAIRALTNRQRNKKMTIKKL
ncbi:MAG: tetratricopeptide repeat protein [Patescibacteria group bacterium]